MQKITVFANAKINLSLDITARREDGYHLLHTVMHSVTLHDTVTLARCQSERIELICSDPALCTGDNLALRAAKAYLAAAGLAESGLVISLCKRIPMQAGLGGGSADAAAVLTALNRMHQNRLPDTKLQELALALGADVPFCLFGGAMLALGVGERLTPLPGLERCFIVIVKPPFGVSTAAAYRRCDEIALTHPRTGRMEAALGAQSLSAVASALCNVFEQAVDHAEIASVKSRLLSLGALGACMSGSGTAVFGIFEEKAAAQRCLAALNRAPYRAFLCEPARSGCEITEEI